MKGIVSLLVSLLVTTVDLQVCFLAYVCRCIKLRYDTIREVHKRRYLLRHSALEVFAVDGRSHFLIFISKYRDKICQKYV